MADHSWSVTILAVSIIEKYHLDLDIEKCMKIAMIHWGDTLRSGVLLQVCFIFQKMILGEISPSYELNEAYFEIWGIDKLTGNEKYNRNFFEILKSLPDFYKDLMKAKTIEERRKKLENMYSLIKSQIGQKVGGFRHTDVNGNIIRYDEPSIPWPPEDDVSMLARFAQCDYPSYDKKIVASIRKEQMKRYEERKKGKNRPGNTELEAEIAEDRIADGFLAITEGELVPETKEMAPMEEQ